MKTLAHVLTFFLLLLLLSPATAEVLYASRNDRQEPLPMHLDGSMMPYSFNAPDSVISVPDSLNPVYISYVARHGARFISSSKKVVRLQDILYSRAMNSALTGKGEKFQELITKVLKATAGNWGRLSPVGIEEQRILARQLYSLYPVLMKKGDIEAVATYVPRVVMTMYQFCHELACCSSGLDIHTSEGKLYNPLLRFFETDSVYSDYRKDGIWQEVYDNFVDEHVPTAPAERIIGLNSGLDNSELRKLTMDIYGILQALPASGLPQPDTEFMTPEEYELCWQADNLEHYLRNSISSYSDAAGTAAGGLLQRIVDEADAQLSGNTDTPLAASLFFGHAETLMPLFSLMSLPGCFALPLDVTSLKSSDSLASQWKDYDIVPLGANLLLVFYKSASGNDYVAVRLNGNFISPLDGDEKIVAWPALRDYWLQRLSSLHND